MSILEELREGLALWLADEHIVPAYPSPDDLELTAMDYQDTEETTLPVQMPEVEQATKH